MTDIREKLVEIFDNNGVYIVDNDMNFALDIDSIQTISIIVGIEEAFDVTLPEEFLVSSLLTTFNDYEQLLIAIINK